LTPSLEKNTWVLFVDGVFSWKKRVGQISLCRAVPCRVKRFLLKIFGEIFLKKMY
jgi:hypothetical protein